MGGVTHGAEPDITATRAEHRRLPHGVGRRVGTNGAGLHRARARARAPPAPPGLHTRPNDCRCGRVNDISGSGESGFSPDVRDAQLPSALGIIQTLPARSAIVFPR